MARPVAARPSAPPPARSGAHASRRHWRGAEKISKSRNLAVVVAGAGPEGREPEPEFVRTPNQERLKVADDAVKAAQRDAGGAISGLLERTGLAKALGIASREKQQTGSDAAEGEGRGEGREGRSKDLRRSGQSAKWLRAREALLEAGTKSVAAKQARDMVRSGAARILDVRPKEEFAAFRAKGSLSAQYYRFPDAGDMANIASLVRQAAYAAQGVKAVEKNDSFVQDALSAVGEAGKCGALIVACGNGGTLTETENFPGGQSSRSLLGCADLLSSGSFGKGKVEIMHLRGGLNAWFREGGDGEGTEAGWDDTSGAVPFVEGYSVPQDAEELM